MQHEQRHQQQTHRQHQRQRQHLLPFDAVRSSGIWEGLSFRDGSESSSDETRWKETSLVFSDFNEKHRCTAIGGKHGHGGGQVVTSLGIADDPENIVARFVGTGLSQWRGRTIPFKIQGYITCATLTDSNQQPAAGGAATAAVLRITLVKRHLGAFSNVVRYEGIMSQNGLEIQGTFADRRFRLCQVDPVAHVLAKELSGAWDGESSCRRGGQSNTTWKKVRLSITPLPSGDGRGWGMVVSGGGDSLWNDQRIPFCVTGRLSLPGLEVELEKQHMEGYHNRIAYFGRLLAGGGGRSAGDKGGQPAATEATGAAGVDDAARTVRLVGVYEHGDFVLHRTLPVEFDADSDGVGQSTSVLQACMDLFQRCSDPNSSWSMSGGARRSLLVQPTARSFSGIGGPPPPPPPPPLPLPSHAVQAVQPQALPIRSALQQPRPPALAKVGTNPISEALASWAEGNTNANNSIRKQAQKHRCPHLTKDWRGENASPPALPVAAAEASPPGFAAWDVQEPWEHSAAVATAPSARPPTALPSAPPGRPSVFSTTTQDAEPSGGDLTFAATAASAQAAAGVTSLAGRPSGDLDWLDYDARLNHNFGSSSTSVAFSIAEERVRGIPSLASGVGGSGTRAASAAAAGAQAAAAASSIGVGPVSSSNGGPGGSPALVPGSGGGGRTDADSLPGNVLLEHELERTIAGSGPNDASAMYASGALAAKGMQQECNGWTGILDDIRINGGDSEGVGGSSATGAAPGTSPASIPGFDDCAGDGGNYLFFSQAAAAGGGSGIGGAGRAASEDWAGRAMLQRTRIDDLLGAAAAAARRGPEARRTVGVSSMFAENNEDSVGIQARGVKAGTCGNGEMAQSPATSGGGLDFGLGLGEPLPPAPRAPVYKNRSADLCMLSFSAVHERNDVPNGAVSGNDDGALLAAKVADYREALTALILGDGVDRVVLGTGEVAGKSRARHGDVEDLRVLRACLLDPAIPDGVHLKMLKSVITSSGGGNAAHPSELAAALPTLAEVDRRELESCKICFTGDSDTLFLPCGHLCVCSMCALRVHTCPICRVDIHPVQPVYRS